jgi:hypothetical protein
MVLCVNTSLGMGKGKIGKQASKVMQLYRCVQQQQWQRPAAHQHARCLSWAAASSVIDWASDNVFCCNSPWGTQDCRELG